MCGLVGMVAAFQNGFNRNEVDTFADLLVFDQVRGHDSTGVFGVDLHSNVEIHKAAIPGGAFVGTKEFKDFKASMVRSGMFMAGHNRSATRGNVVDANAHPFVVDDKIVLMQNGTMYGDHKKHKDVEVDTEAVAHVIAETEDVATALKKINASYAFVWFNVNTKTLHLIRNDQRPLYTLETMQGGYLWASEPVMLYAAAGRNGLKYGDKRAVELAPENLLTFKIEGKRWVREETKLQCAFTFQQETTDWAAEWDMHNNAETNITRITPPDEQISRRILHLENSTKGASLDMKSPGVVTHSLFEELQKYGSEYHLTRETALKVVEVVNNIPRQKECFVELFDYIPANNNVKCSTWIVFGKFVEMPGSLLDKSLVHWFVYNKQESEVLDYVGDTWYTAFLSSCRAQLDKEGKCIVSAFMNRAVCCAKSVQADAQQAAH